MKFVDLYSYMFCFVKEHRLESKMHNTIEVDEIETVQFFDPDIMQVIAVGQSHMVHHDYSCKKATRLNFLTGSIATN